MNIHFADAWERVAATYPDRTAVVCDGKGLSWREYEHRAAKFARVLSDAGLTTNSKVGIYLHNCNEYQEAQFGVLKIGGCPINVNYRYKSDELVYLLENSDAEAVVYQASYAMRIWEIKDRLPNIKLFVQVNDGTEALMNFAVDYERCLRDVTPMPAQERDPNGVYMFYTGGTTGLPKGVMYPVGEFADFFITMGAAGQELTPPTSLAEYEDFLAQAQAPTTVVGCPLMHGTGMWLGGFLPHLLGGTSVTTAKLGLDPHLLWSMVEDQRATDLIIVGDAFARPLLEALDGADARNTPYDISSLRQITSSGVMWSQETKQGLLAHHDMILADIMGSTEGGMGSSITTRETDATKTASFTLNEGVKVFTEEGDEVRPGSEVIGKIATSGMVPLGYYKDEAKSAETFKEIDGVRYSFPGDFATVEADGSITLLGRGSVCINTGGEKVFPEEVEEAVKKHADVVDCLVVGVGDERFGQKVVAVASRVDNSELDVEDLIAFSKDHIAGYKAPREVVWVDRVQRAPNGKADYKWAAKQAERLS